MFTVVVLMMVAAVFGGAAFVIFGKKSTAETDDLECNKAKNDLFRVDGPAVYGTPGSVSQIVVLPNGEHGFRNGLTLGGKHF